MNKHMSLTIIVGGKSIMSLNFDEIEVDDDRVRFYNNDLINASIDKYLFKHNLKILMKFRSGNMYKLIIKDLTNEKTTSNTYINKNPTQNL